MDVRHLPDGAIFGTGSLRPGASGPHTNHTNHTDNTNHTSETGSTSSAGHTSSTGARSAQIRWLVY